MAKLDQRYRGTIGTAVAAAAGVAVPGAFVPTLDMASMGAIWTTMIGAIAINSGREVSIATVTKLVSSALSAVGAYQLGSTILNWILIIVLPGGGMPAAVALNVLLNGLFTLKLGAATAKQLSHPGFTKFDILATVHQVVTLPSVEEIKLVKDMISGA